MTIGEALVTFVLTDSVIATQIKNLYPAATIPQEPPNNYGSYRLMPSGSVGNSQQGPSNIQRMRIEVTFWGDLNSMMERLAVRLGMISQGVNGPLSGGPTVCIYSFIGPRSVENPVTRDYGSQIDLMALVDLSTVS